MKKGKGSRVTADEQEHELASGVDELNLAEFPLASVSDRFLGGEKTVVFEDTVFCREQQRRHLPRRLTISGSDRYGLPTAKDDDILLACIQISSLSDFASPEVQFSRYEILRLLRLSDDAKHYSRIATSLRRWKGLTIYSDRAFYDHEHKSWVNRDFGVFDNLYIYRKEAAPEAGGPRCSRFVWNEVIYRSFQAGYLKQIDWGLYTRLTNPVAKRLYRFLDKRFYHGNRVEIDLRELAVQKVRLSDQYNVAQMKRVLLKGIAELEVEWELKQADTEQRFVKIGKGLWKAVFERKTRKSKPAAPAANVLTSLAPTAIQFPSPLDVDSLAIALTRRGIGPGTADELTGSCPLATIQTMIELFDWYNNHGQSRGPGFLVSAIKNPAGIAFPKGFESSVTIEAKKAAEKNRIGSERELRTKRERDAAQKENARQEAFLAFWRGLCPAEQSDFERDALDAADPTKRSGYLRTMGKRTSPTFEHYRMVILRDHFERTAQSPTRRPS